MSNEFRVVRSRLRNIIPPSVTGAVFGDAGGLRGYKSFRCIVVCTLPEANSRFVTIYFHLIKKTDMLNRWKNKEKATGPGSSNTLPVKGSAKKKRKTGREGGKAS